MLLGNESVVKIKRASAAAAFALFIEEKLNVETLQTASVLEPDIQLKDFINGPFFYDFHHKNS
jgi:hypothetical protein